MEIINFEKFGNFEKHVKAKKNEKFGKHERFRKHEKFVNFEILENLGKQITPPNKKSILNMAAAQQGRHPWDAKKEFPPPKSILNMAAAQQGVPGSVPTI